MWNEGLSSATVAESLIVLNEAQVHWPQSIDASYSFITESLYLGIHLQLQRSAGTYALDLQSTDDKHNAFQVQMQKISKKNIFFPLNMGVFIIIFKM